MNCMILLPFYSSIPKIEHKSYTALQPLYRVQVLNPVLYTGPIFSGLLYVVLKNTSTTLEVEIFVIDAI